VGHQEEGVTSIDEQRKNGERQTKEEQGRVLPLSRDR
jgi:hypothetical protein